eukprot:gene1380-1400_t
MGWTAELSAWKIRNSVILSRMRTPAGETNSLPAPINCQTSVWHLPSAVLAGRFIRSIRETTARILVKTSLADSVAEKHPSAPDSSSRTVSAALSIASWISLRHSFAVELRRIENKAAKLLQDLHNKAEMAACQRACITLARGLDLLHRDQTDQPASFKGIRHLISLSDRASLDLGPVCRSACQGGANPWLCEHVLHAVALTVELDVVGQSDVSGLKHRYSLHNTLRLKGVAIPITAVAAQHERPILAVAHRMQFGVRAAFCASDTTGNNPFLSMLAAARCALRYVASGLEDTIEQAEAFLPGEAVMKRLARTIDNRRVTPANTVPDDENDPALHPARSHARIHKMLHDVSVCASHLWGNDPQWTRPTEPDAFAAIGIDVQTGLPFSLFYYPVIDSYDRVNNVPLWGGVLLIYGISCGKSIEKVFAVTCKLEGFRSSFSQIFANNFSEKADFAPLRQEVSDAAKKLSFHLWGGTFHLEPQEIDLNMAVFYQASVY